MIDAAAREALTVLGATMPPVVLQGERVVVGDDLNALAGLVGIGSRT
jgi:hypothetical protein